MNTSDDDDTFQSLDRVQLQFQRGVSETFTAEDFTYAEVTVLDDDDESASDDSSEEAFIEVNHDDASVVSNLTVETALERKAKKKRKKKGPKKSKKGSKSKKLASSMMHEKIEEEEEADGSKSEASERTQRTTKTAKSTSSRKSKNGKVRDANSVSGDTASQEEIIEVTSSPSPPIVSEQVAKKIEKAHLPALSTLDTISAQPTSTNAIAGSFKRTPSRTSGESDTASQSPPPVPRKSDHSIEQISNSPEAKSMTDAGSVIQISAQNEKRATNSDIPSRQPKADPPTDM